MSSFASSRRPSAASQVIAGGFLLATIDLLYACSFWALLRDVPPMRVMQFIASGALGQSAFGGGMTTALAGVAFHYFIATVMVYAYHLAGGRYRALLARPVWYGLLYGVVLWLAMNYVVVPLSLARPSANPWWVAELSNFAMHLPFGVICAWFARRAHGLQR